MAHRKSLQIEDASESADGPAGGRRVVSSLFALAKTVLGERSEVQMGISSQLSRGRRYLGIRMKPSITMGHLRCDNTIVFHDFAK